MLNSGIRLFSALSISAGLSACGFSAPRIQELWDGKEGAKQIEFGIKKRIYCDLKRGIINANKSKSGTVDLVTGKTEWKQFFPNDWGASVSLSLQVDESTSINPGVALSKPLPDDQLFTLGLGGSFSSAATRTDKFDAYYPIGYLMIPETDTSICHAKNDPFKGLSPATSSPFIQSELGIENWLKDAMFTNTHLHSIDPQNATKTTDTITYEAKFVVTTNGSVNPTWRLVHFTGNTGGNLFSTGRSRTHTVIVTIGPQKGQTSQTHFASQIGQAVADANRGILRP